MDKIKAWSTKRDGFKEALSYINGRRKGLAGSLKTPWSKFNDAGTDGIEWHSLTVIGARPGGFKTALKDQIIREAFKLNPGENIRILDFQLEMVQKTSAIRDFSNVLGKSYKYVCSAAGNKLTDEEINKCHEYAKKVVEYPIDIVEEAPSVEEFVQIVHDYMKEHSIVEDKKIIYKKTLITLDHTILIKKGSKPVADMLYDLGAATTQLKRIYPIAFVFLSQLNRNIDSPERNNEGTYGNYVSSSDLFGADAMMMFGDIVIGINRPALQKIRYYGPDRYIIADDTILVFHWIKTRNGDTRLSFFKAEFEKMQIIEIDTPPKAERTKK